MRILVIDDKYVDFEAPICMTMSQRKKLIKFLNKMFPDEYKGERIVTEKDRSHPSPKTSKKWTIDDLYILLTSKDNIRTLALKLNRDEMSITMKSADFMPEFFKWMKNNEYKYPITKEMINKFLKERGRK